MGDHDQLFADAEKAIDDLFGDTSVSQQKTVEALYALQEKIESCIEAIESDLEHGRETDDA